MKAFIACSLLLQMSLVGYAQQIYQNNVPDYLKKIDTNRQTVNLDATHRVPPAPKYTKDNLNNDSAAFASAPLMLLKLNQSGKMVKSLFSTLGIIRQEDIASMEIFKDSKADSLYGARGKHGVIIVELISTAKTYTMPQYLEHFNVSKKDMKLPVYLDYYLLCNTDGLWLTDIDVKSVTVEKDKNGRKFISIISNRYPYLRVHPWNDKEEHDRMVREKNK